MVSCPIFEALKIFQRFSAHLISARFETKLKQLMCKFALVMGDLLSKLGHCGCSILGFT